VTPTFPADENFVRSFLSVTPTFLADEGFVRPFLSVTPTFLADEGFVRPFLSVTPTFLADENFVRPFWSVMPTFAAAQAVVRSITDDAAGRPANRSRGSWGGRTRAPGGRDGILVSAERAARRASRDECVTPTLTRKQASAATRATMKLVQLAPLRVHLTDGPRIGQDLPL